MTDRENLITRTADVDYSPGQVALRVMQFRAPRTAAEGAGAGADRPPTSADYLDLCSHLARVTAQRDMLAAGCVPWLFWRREKPVSSGRWLNCQRPEGDWTVIEFRIDSEGCLHTTQPYAGLGPWWAGPLDTTLAEASGGRQPPVEAAGAAGI